jgi:hypothetical protein
MTTNIDAIEANATSRLAHHEAGHVVAAVARGGELISVHLGYADWSTMELSGDIPGEAHYQINWETQPFVTFAGVWAEARWTVEHDPEVDDIDDALEYAWDNSDGDAAKYGERVKLFTAATAHLGFPVGAPVWEWDWCEELEMWWPAICEVAALLIDGKPVTHDDVDSAIARVVDDEAESS